MNWTGDLEARVKNPKTPTASGTSCYFVQLSNETGLKLYATPEERDASYIAQSIGYENGIAPRAGQCIEIEGLKIEEEKAPAWWKMSLKRRTPAKLYGFLTEIVDIEVSRNCSASEECRVKNLAESLGFYADDCWRGRNMGATKDGRLVIFDWDGRFSRGLLTAKEKEKIARFFTGGSPWM